MSGVILEVLFVPRKAESLSIFRRAAEGMDLNLHICTDPAEVERLLFCHRYDGLIVDHDDNTEILLRTLRQSPSSKGAIAIDVHDASVNLQQIFAMGANFEIVYPLSVDRVRRTLHLAMGLMLLGRRRYYRHSVEIEAQLEANGKQVTGIITNLSEQGIGLRCEDFYLRTGTVQCTFMLPDNSTTVSATATVVWSDQRGQAGCRVEQFQSGREEYLNWLTRLFHQRTSRMAIPLAVRATESSAIGTV